MDQKVEQKEVANDCCAGGGDVMIQAYSCGSNVSRLSNQAAVELTQEGFGKMFCMAGIGGKLSGFVQSARDVSKMVPIDCMGDRNSYCLSGELVAFFNVTII